MQDRIEMENRRMQERDREREREWNRDAGYPYQGYPYQHQTYPYQRDRGEFRDRPDREYSFQRRREEDEGYNMGGQRYGRDSTWGPDSPYQRRFEYEANFGREYGRDFGRDYGDAPTRWPQWRERQWRESQWHEPERSQSRFGGNEYERERREEEYGRGGPQWNEPLYRSSSGRFGGGMGTYGGGLSEYGERGRFSGRGPKGFQRSDERIREDVCERLTRHHDVDAIEIDVKVNNGEVTLTGSVDERSMKRLAEEVAEQVFGVRDVHNQIRVQQPATSQTSHGAQLTSGGGPAKGKS